VRRARRYLDRPEIREHRVRLLSRRLRYELARAVGRRALERERTIRLEDGLRFRVRLTDEIERAVYLFGVFEHLTLRALTRLLPPGGTFVDGGAHVGYFTLRAARLVGESGSVLAFEPDERNRARLEANVRLNGLANVRVLPYALLDRDGVVSFAAAAGDNTGVGRIVDEGTAAVQVPAVRLDDALEEARIARVDAIKLDVEGAEAAALAGAAETLRRHRPAVLFEVNEVTRENGVFTAPAIDVLRAHGYAIHAIAENGLVELDPKVDPRPYAERWHALNLVALHRRSSR